MASYLFIESRDPFESRDTGFVADAAVTLKQRGSDVTVFLVQNGVLTARKNCIGSHVPHLAEAGVTLLADDFSLRERGIAFDEVAPEIRESNIDDLVDMLIKPDTKAIWH